MKLDSKYFDSVRVRPDHEKAVAQEAPACQWKGCSAPACTARPRGRGHEGEYYLLCLEHVRQFNASYNYFEGMSNADIEAYQKDSVTGHRPTWKAGANAWAHGTRHGMGHMGGHGRALLATRTRFSRGARHEPTAASSAPHAQAAGAEIARIARSGGRRRPRDEIKARFKELVKRHHPDANGGDKRSEDKLREIIQAYNYLKQAGLV